MSSRFLTRAGILRWADLLRWVGAHRAFSRYHLVRYWRFLWFRLRYPRVTCPGPIFLGRDVRVVVRPGYARLIIEPLAHLGDGTRLYAHEGTLRIGAKSVLGRQVTITAYLDVDVGGSCLLADWTYITDFDHETGDPSRPIKDQGLAKSPVRVGDGCWLGVRSTVLRGSRVGDGSVIGAHAVVRGEVPATSIAVGAPARVVRDRADAWGAEEERRAYLDGLARGDAADRARARVRRTPEGGAPSEPDR